MSDPATAARALYRLAPRLAFTVLFAYIAVRLLLQAEWFGGATAGILALLLAWATRRSWLSLRHAARVVETVPDLEPEV